VGRPFDGRGDPLLRMKMGASVPWMIFSATLPRRKCFRPPYPWVVKTRRSVADEFLRISEAGSPWVKR
jgi:hypothetical protein